MHIHTRLAKPCKYFLKVRNAFSKRQAVFGACLISVVDIVSVLLSVPNSVAYPLVHAVFVFLLSNSGE